jgi:hypothetical protein
VHPAKAEEVITTNGSALLNRRRVNTQRSLCSASPAETLRALSVQSIADRQSFSALAGLDAHPLS